jgi:hypothetical protein
MNETRQERQAYLRGYIREKTEEFIGLPTGAAYHHLKNKLAEYYSLCQVIADEEYAAVQADARKAMGIGASNG